MNSLSQSFATQPLTAADANIMFWITFGTIVFIGLTQMFMVYMTRKSLLFGVRIPESKVRDPHALKLKNLYYLLVAVATIITLVLYYFFGQGAEPKTTLIFALVIYLPMLLLYSLIYIYSWKRALKLKADQGWLVPKKLSAQISIKPKQKQQIPYLFYALPLLIIAALTAYSFTQFASLPAELPTHFDISMKPDAWAPKSAGVLLIPLGVAVLTTALMILSNYLIVRQKLQVSSEKPELSYAQHRAYRTLMGKVLSGFNFALMFPFLGILLSTTGMIPESIQLPFSIASMVIVLGATLALVIIGMRAGQGGANLKPEIKEEDHVLAYGKASEEFSEAELIDRQDDKYWVLGTFYYNEDDPALLIENRFGSNTGFNYARPFAWLISLLLVLVIVVPIWWMIAQIP